jgi:hypothetical protein
MTYGQTGERKKIFLLAHYYHLRNIMMINYRTKVKINYNLYDYVPLPENFYYHIKENQLTNPFVINSDKQKNIYINLINYHI